MGHLVRVAESPGRNDVKPRWKAPVGVAETLGTSRGILGTSAVKPWYKTQLFTVKNETTASLLWDLKPGFGSLQADVLSVLKGG